ncbi:NmrA family protein [Neorhizobium lilium]|uniref:NmrA family protein n=1 Tax=Neorhizobium lilium TaxID=2503024 RepID=A0A444LBD0_9HYPH|nr:NAD(P)H-binding protein [Neorhizobium lilium]RWX74968.1 NmrA family protein [Neorhizobium lilium]
MSAAPILVTGATGRLGRLVVERLTAAGQLARVFTRRPDVALKLFGPAVQIAIGEFADPVSLATAMRGVERLLLLSPISPALAADQLFVVKAASIAGLGRIVKISGSDWTIDPPGSSISGEAHAIVERHLRGLAMEHVSLRPNAWMQVSLANTIRQVLDGKPVFTGNPDAGIGYIDARDIADVAVHQLSAEAVVNEVLNLTGPAVVTPRRVAGLLSEILNRQVPVIQKLPPATAYDEFEHRAVAQFATLIAAGRAAATTDTVATLLGHAPRSVEAFISEQLASKAALAGSSP